MKLPNFNPNEPIDVFAFLDRDDVPSAMKARLVKKGWSGTNLRNDTAIAQGIRRMEEEAREIVKDLEGMKEYRVLLTQTKTTESEVVVLARDEESTRKQVEALIDKHSPSDANLPDGITILDLIDRTLDAVHPIDPDVEGDRFFFYPVLHLTDDLEWEDEYISEIKIDKVIPLEKGATA